MMTARRDGCRAMNWFTGVVLMCSFGGRRCLRCCRSGAFATRPDPATGWRGAPEHPRLVAKVIATSIVAGIIWFGAWLLITSPI